MCRLLPIQLVFIQADAVFHIVYNVLLYIVEDCMRRWKTLRERLARELKKKKKKSGDPADNSPLAVFRSTLIKEFIKHRRYLTCCIFFLYNQNNYTNCVD